jgi:hypothetical protein
MSAQNSAQGEAGLGSRQFEKSLASGLSAQALCAGDGEDFAWEPLSAVYVFVCP